MLNFFVIQIGGDRRETEASGSGSEATACTGCHDVYLRSLLVVSREAVVVNVLSSHSWLHKLVLTEYVVCLHR